MEVRTCFEKGPSSSSSATFEPKNQSGNWDHLKGEQQCVGVKRREVDFVLLTLDHQQ